MAGLVAELAAAEPAEVVELTAKINVLAKRIETRVRQAVPTLLAMPGVGPLTGTEDCRRDRRGGPVQDRGGVRPALRDRADPGLAGNTAGRVRLTRSGNRQLKTAIHRIAITHIRLDGIGQAYYPKKKAEGMSNREALRRLKRRLVRVVQSHLHLPLKPG